MESEEAMTAVPDADADANSGGLIIERIETIPVKVPLRTVFRGSAYRMDNRATIVIRLHTAGGIVGEAYAGDEGATLREIDAVVHTEIAPRLIGHDAFATEQCWQLGYPVTYDILRDCRIGLVALALVDSAVWDAVGKALGQPLWRLWGGYTDTLPLMAIGGYYGEPLGPIEREIADYRELGLAGLKFKVGGRSPLEDARRVRAARRAAGDDFILTVDANQGYTTREAIEFARAVADLDIRWFEEPVRWHNDRMGLRDVRLAGGLPVCAGQSELSPSGCRELMQAGAIDVCNFDASWSGGPTAWRRTAAIATSYDVAMGHHEEPQVSAHLLASQPHGTYAECFHPERDPFWWNLIVNRPALAGGRMTLSEAPGFGWQLDWDYITAHRLD
jgi:L-alanine-DL-glutamate epimerase-like enolase superfamily enzyme